MTSRVPALGLVLAALCVVAACSAAPADPEVVLQVMLADDWVDTAPVIEAVRTFEADNPGVTVNLVGRPFSQIEDELAASVAQARPLDVVQHHAFAAGARGTAEPLDELWRTHLDADAHFPGAIADVTWGDTFYGVPLDINAMFLVLDADMARRLGVPTTFRDVESFARAAAEEGRRGLMASSDSWLVYGWMRANGGEIVEVADDGTPTFTLDRAENVEALDLLGRLVADDLAFGPTSRNVTTDAFSLFVTGSTAMLTTGTWDTAALQAEHPEVAFTTAPLPGGLTGATAGSALGGSSLMVGRGSGHVEQAVALIRALTADDVALAMARQEGRLPPRPDLFSAPELDTPVMRTLQQQLGSAHPQQLIAFPEAQQAFASAIDEVLTGRADAATALARAQADAIASLDGS